MFKSKNLKFILFGLIFIVVAVSAYFLIYGINRKMDVKKDIESTKNYIGISMLDYNGNLLPSRDVKLNDKAIFKNRLRISNFIQSDRQYLLKIFDNDEFIEFTLDNNESSEHYINFHKDEEKTFNLTIDNFKYSGKHDMVLFLIAQPKNNQFSEIERSMGKVTTSRFNVTISGQENNISKAPDNLDIKNYFTDVFNETIDFTVTEDPIKSSKDGLKINSIIKYKNELKNLHIYLSNNTDNAIKNKIICLKNWSITNMGGKSYILVSIPPHKKIEIPIEVNINSNDNGNDLMFFRINSPFESMDDSNLNILTHKNIPINIDNSTRMLIQGN